MTGPRRGKGEGRLRSLRLVGFKSFAERTVVEFGPGISAIVGPNGSGKSNLADALRWALGEQGRSLRTRKAEDVIFAGSASRSATGMADVGLTIGNEDGLLPVDFAEVDLGRRLYRSGENEYLLNRERVRLRDVVELLDAANLADNAFLFIGQGMVDQALSLRPEERRSLFEEAAGVRRHERRKRQAEAQLAEAEANLARVRDILAELRPQARRLAAQVDQQRARGDAARELAEILVALARQRIVAGATASADASRQLGTARSAADRALSELRSAEEEAASIARALSARAAEERTARAALDAARVGLTDLRLAEGRRRSDLEAVLRERGRIDEERVELETRLTTARRALAEPLPEDERTSSDELAEVDRQLASADAELARFRETEDALGEGEAALQRAVADRGAAMRRLRTEAGRLAEHAAEDRERAATAEDVQSSAAERLVAARQERQAALAAEAAAETAASETREAAEGASGRLRARVAAAAEVEARLAALSARLEALQEEVEADEGRSLITAARRRGGRPIADGLEVDAAFRAPVEAALGAALLGVAVDEAALSELRGRSGTALLPVGMTREAVAPDALLDAVLEAGGGPLAEGVRRDPDGHAARLLARTLWVPELDAALALRDRLPLGWRIATAAGELVDADGVVELGTGARRLELRAERERLATEISGLEAEAARAREAERAARDEEARTRHDMERARGELEAVRGRRRAAEESERVAARHEEAASRERTWAASRLAAREAELERTREALRRLEREATADSPRAAGAETSSGVSDERAGGKIDRLAAFGREVDRLRERREALVEAARVVERGRREREERRRRAEVSLGIDEARLAQLERDFGSLAGRAAALEEAIARSTEEIAHARESESRAADQLATLDSADEGGRERLGELETRAAQARERLRAAEERSRLAERVELEQRLQLEGAREGLLVELAALGAAGLAALESVSDEEARVGEEELAGRLEGALARRSERWTAEATAGEGAETETEAPSQTRLATLRRRYHELGASNPFAAEEYEEVRERLDGLEAQREDLETAIGQTRGLIEELTRLMTERFQSTFAALEAAFGRRFEQLFSGGEASLLLTEPEDLAATGIEIVARPPGKKRQPLAMLSGGERALTAVALLFAMLEVRPVPFCVLDEVDAALDEANITRFAGALRELAQATQFVVITHNRGTIESADALYGVTIGDDAVSRVISIRLSDVEAAEAVEARVRDRVAAPA
ncbi:MAG TPA: chromosome segregation protein SMC [Candidatus Limnocylindrales bacterium]|jgi:chromosome segregation protein|nr:chromosome segregation protein SMC [Candidatus Limnocylindrales bacterium]